MSSKGYTGRYKYDPVSGELVRISELTPNVQVFDVHVPEGGYWSHNLGHKPVFIESRAQKRRLLEAHGVRERGQLTRREI